jgi:hypothetical protein
MASHDVYIDCLMDYYLYFTLTKSGCIFYRFVGQIIMWNLRWNCWYHIFHCHYHVKAPILQTCLSGTTIRSSCIMHILDVCFRYYVKPLIYNWSSYWNNSYNVYLPVKVYVCDAYWLTAAIIDLLRWVLNY